MKVELAIVQNVGEHNSNDNIMAKMTRKYIYKFINNVLVIISMHNKMHMQNETNKKIM